MKLRLIQNKAGNYIIQEEDESTGLWTNFYEADGSWWDNIADAQAEFDAVVALETQAKYAEDVEKVVYEAEI